MANNHLPKTAPPAVAPKAADPALQPHLLGHLCPLLAGGDEEAKAAVLAYFEAMAPQDPVEELVISQMLAAFEAGMTCFRRAATEVDKLGLRDIELRHGEKLFNVFSRLLEGLEKRRKRMKIERLLPGLPGLTQIPRM